MSIKDELKKYERFWQQPEKFYIVRHQVNSASINPDDKIRYSILEPMPGSDRAITFGKELGSIIVAKMLEAGAKVFNSFPDKAINDAMRAKRINEFVLVKNENANELSGNYFTIWHKPTLHLFTRFDGSRQTLINEYEQLIKMGIEIWSEEKWNAYKEALEQNNDNIPRWSEIW